MAPNYMMNNRPFTERLFNLSGLNQNFVLVISLLVILVIKCPGAMVI